MSWTRRPSTRLKTGWSTSGKICTLQAALFNKSIIVQVQVSKVGGEDRVAIAQCLSPVLHVVGSVQHLVVPSTRRASIGDCAFAVAGPLAWNSLPPALRSTSTSFTTFKKELKSFLFGLSFCLRQRIPFIDYVQCYSSSLYRRLCYRN